MRGFAGLYGATDCHTNVVGDTVDDPLATLRLRHWQPVRANSGQVLWGGDWVVLRQVLVDNPARIYGCAA